MPAVLVVPTYQEAENIERFLRAVRAQCPALDVLVVDDNSPDGTGAIAERVAGDVGGIEVLHRAHKAGLGAAYRHGFRHALNQGYDVVGQMDADFSHDPEVLPRLLAAVEDGADVAVGSRYVPGGGADWTWSRRMLSRWGNWYARKMLRLRINDATTAFRIYGPGVLDRIRIDGTRANGYLFQIETAFRLSVSDVSVAELPIFFVDRVAGNSKMAVVRTMVETELRVTWWGLSLRLPNVSKVLRSSPPGQFLEARVRPVVMPPVD
ncbi:MAG: polyprenol monophosphomannose synthase [Actinomycetes bacterium]